MKTMEWLQKLWNWSKESIFPIWLFFAGAGVLLIALSAGDIIIGIPNDQALLRTFRKIIIPAH